MSMPFHDVENKIKIVTHEEYKSTRVACSAVLSLATVPFAHQKAPRMSAAILFHPLAINF
jgi:hypothetical protein